MSVLSVIACVLSSATENSVLSSTTENTWLIMETSVPFTLHKHQFAIYVLPCAMTTPMTKKDNFGSVLRQ